VQLRVAFVSMLHVRQTFGALLNQSLNNGIFRGDPYTAIYATNELKCV